MPLPQLGELNAQTVEELIDELAKYRKELMFVLENLDTTNVNGFNAEVINAGVINGKHLHIDSNVSFADGYDPEGLRHEMNTQFSVVDGQIQGKVSIDTFNALDQKVQHNSTTITQTATEIRSEAAAMKLDLDGKISQANSTITQTATSIRQEVSTSVSRLDGRIDTANASISTLSGQIALKAESSTVSALGTRMNSAEININGLNSTISSKVSYTDYNGTNIVSMINQTPYYVEIHASKINLYGAVSVLSDISGNLGTITSGNINISNDIYVGNNIYLGRYTGGSKNLIFADTVSIRSDGYGLSLASVTGTTIENATFVGTSVDFSRVYNIIGLPGSGPTSVRYSASSRRLYVDNYGSQVGWINLDG